MRCFRLQPIGQELSTYSAICGLEALQLGGSLILEGLLGDGAGGDKRGKGRRGDFAPETLVFVTEQNHQTGGLGVEGAWDVQDGGIDKLLNLGIGDRAVLAELVDGTAVLGSFNEGVGRHGCARLRRKLSEGRS